MCCIMYYLYIKCRDYFRKPPRQEEQEEDTGKSLSEVVYNARRLNEYKEKGKNVLD